MTRQNPNSDPDDFAISDALESFADGPAKDAANATADAFENAGERIAKALEKAARRGEFSFDSLAQSLAQDFAKFAISDLIVAPLQSALAGLGKGGGGAAGKTAPNVTLNISGVTDAQSFKRSEGQISAGLARAVSQGGRYI